jgi:prepilin-type N-terminal cleavage/methylation domain-containing protein
MTAKRRNPQRRAFTLIELLVVIAIISLLVSILMPSLKKAKDLARRAASMANLRSIGIGMALYAEQFNGELPRHTSTSPPTHATRYWYASQLDALAKEMGCFTDNGPGGWYADGGLGANTRYSRVFLSPCVPDSQLVGYSYGQVVVGYFLTTAGSMFTSPAWGYYSRYRFEPPARIDQTKSELRPHLPFSTVIVSDYLAYESGQADAMGRSHGWRGNGVPGYSAAEPTGDPANAPSGAGCLNLHLMGNVEWRDAGEVEPFVVIPGWTTQYY